MESEKHDPGLLKGLQERAARALPAEMIEYADGWWLRCTTSSSWWVGSILPHGESDSADLRDRVEQAEDFHLTRGTHPTFQISPGVCPIDLDGLLEDRGYRKPSDHTSLQTATAAEVLNSLPPSRLQTHVDDHLTPEWFKTWQEVHGDSTPELDRDLLERVDLPSAFVRAMLGDRVIAVGRAVADTGWAGFFNLTTRPEARGKGGARAALAALATWSAEQGAEGMYLQVEARNTPALALYRQAAFTEVLTYHYRIAK